MILKKLSIPLCLFAVNAMADGGTLNQSIITQRTTFESQEDLNKFPANGEFSLSTKRFKEGQQSLLWKVSGKSISLGKDSVPGITKAAQNWPGGQPETFEPSFIPESMQGGIKLWIYREQANPKGELTFQIGSDQKNAVANPKYKFAMKQNFTGWRALWVHFEEDAKVADYSGSDLMTAMEIIPHNMSGDELHLDLMQFLTFISRKRHSDAQFVNNKTQVRVDTYLINNHWKKLKDFSKIEHELSTQEKQAFDIISQRLEYLILGQSQSSKAQKNFDQKMVSRLKHARAELKALNIQVKDDLITGRPLFSSRDEQPAEDYGTFQIVGSKTFYPLALDYRKAPTTEKLADLLKLFEHFKDQGFTAASALGTTDHIIRLNFYSAASFLLRKELKERDLINEKQATLDWHTRFGKLTGWNRLEGENTDLIRGGALPKLTAVLLMDTSPKKAVRMHALMDYFAWSIEDAPGYVDTIKPDGSIFHHRGAYQNSYGIQTLTTLSLINWLTRGTVFELPEKTRSELRKTLIKQYNFAADFELHPALSGRFPYSNDGISRMLLPSLAFCAENEGKIIDPELAEIFARSMARCENMNFSGYFIPGLTFFGTYGTIELMNKVAEYKFEDQKRLANDGFFSFPYAGAANHKREDFVASVRGFSKYIWDFESGHKRENPFGRYSAFGALFLFTGENEQNLLSLKSSGMDLHGFHWGYMPGATTKELPMEKVQYHVAAHPQYGEGKHRNFTEQTFLGGVDHGANGMFAMDLIDTTPADGDEAVFEKGFSAKKSYFFFDNQIICLGTDINSSDQRYNTITTLFQNLHNVDHSTKLTLNGKEKFDDQTQGGIIGDLQSNFYILGEGQSLRMSQGDQKSLVVDKGSKSSKYKKAGLKDVSLPASKAWIDHGKAPKAGNYEYSILVKSNYEKAAALKAKPSYKVLRQDSDAHIAFYGPSSTSAYAIFNPEISLPGVVQKVNTALMIMSSEKKGKLRLSIADPDLRLAKWNHNMSYMPNDIANAPAQPHVSSIYLKGKWQLNEPAENIKVIVRGETTELQVQLIHGMTRSFKFKAID